MDGDRFDDLSRRLATGVSRRRAVKGIVTGLLGALGPRTIKVADAQVTQAQCGNTTCKNNPGKCNAGCVCCVYGNGNSRCMPPGNCGSGGVLTCPPGQVVDPILGCVTTTTTTTLPPVAGTCTSGLDACDGDPIGDGCNGDASNCFCIVSQGGVQVCAQFGLECNEFQTCSSDGDCPAGEYCANISDNCCDTGFCLAPCGTSAASFSAAAAAGNAPPFVTPGR